MHIAIKYFISHNAITINI